MYCILYILYSVYSGTIVVLVYIVLALALLYPSFRASTSVVLPQYTV